jgi:hypothetical protein
MKLVEPPSCSSLSNIVFIGRNRSGQWVAQEQNGLYGGLFINRAQAVKYALSANGDMGDRRFSSDHARVAGTRRIA